MTCSCSGAMTQSREFLPTLQVLALFVRLLCATPLNNV